MKNTFVACLMIICKTLASQAPPNKEIPVRDELQFRYDLTKNRLFKGPCPAYTEDFILNDLQPDPAKQSLRRFSEFSGDLSGRYLSAVSRMPQNEWPVNFNTLVKYVIAMQEADGRFGNPSLVFTPEMIGKDHMALLWGNGRLLVGLMDYYHASPSTEVLQSALNLANFLINAANVCLHPAVIAKTSGWAANGIICMTQINEGLVMLAQATGQNSYAEITRKYYMAMQPRNGQHAHGYLTTLRGVMKLYEMNKDAGVLAFAKIRYDSIINSPDYKITGGVLEYFGDKLPYELHDEGCAEVDFLMLSLQLWKATKEISYLEKAEYCILNHFFFNQFETGDFGHHVVDGNAGYRLSNEEHKAWWCCTLHGMLGFQEIRKNIITTDGEWHKVNFYMNTTFADKSVSLEMKKIKSDRAEYTVSFQLPSSAEVPLAFRKPAWAETFTLMLNNQPLPFEEINGYCVATRKWALTDKIKIIMSYKMSLVTPTGQELQPSQTGQPVEAYMKYGPYLMVADGNAASEFLSFPSHSNIIYISNYKKSNKSDAGSSIPETYLVFQYTHEGFEGRHEVVLRPVAELGAKKHTYFRALLRFAN